MTWPWPEGESWRVGATHDTTKSIWSALDFSLSQWDCRWIYNESCIEPYTPKVLAMHSGTVTRFSRCNVRITHSTGWAPNYYHMDDLTANNFSTIQQGESIGRYAKTYENSICEGGVSRNPHVHFDLIDPDGKHQSLDGWEINGYKVHAGIKDYDRDCDRCYFEKKKKKFCPYTSIKHEKWWWTTKIVDF